MSREPFNLIVEDAYDVAPQVRHIVFRREDQQIFDYKPGQFITIHFEYEGKTLRRSYSIATIPRQSHAIEIAAGYIKGGPGTELLFHLKPGDDVHATGPFGRLVLRDEMPQRYFLLATGTGVTPYRSMLPELDARLQANEQLEVYLLLGVRGREHLLYPEDFNELAQQQSRFHFVPCYSRQDQASLEGMEQTGYVQQVLKNYELRPANDLIYLCGNPGMIDEAFDYLQAQGFAIQNIRREKYIS